MQNLLEFNESILNTVNSIVNEQNAYIVAAANAKMEGKDEFEFPPNSGKMHKVKIDDKVAKKIVANK